MLDQNITTLLSALIGGLLSATGGFLANYYIQSASKKNDKQKGIRNMLEQVYKEILSVEDAYNNIMELKNEHSRDKTGPLYEMYDAYSAQSEEIDFHNSIAQEASQIEGSIKKIDLLVTLYLSPLQPAFNEYLIRVNPLVESIQSGNIDSEHPLSKEDLKKFGKQFQTSLSILLKKRGYSYF